MLEYSSFSRWGLIIWQALGAELESLLVLSPPYIVQLLLQLLCFVNRSYGYAFGHNILPIQHLFNAVYIYANCLNGILQIGRKCEGRIADNILLQNLAQDVDQLSFCRISKVLYRNVIYFCGVSYDFFGVFNIYEWIGVVHFCG